ncbi:MAG: NAD(P)/FAD-dependent oxidoreductase [Paracoccaceae bacterium]
MSAAQAKQKQATPSSVDAVVVGAGFSGMYLIHRLRKMGLSVQAFETGSDVGGTWYWNRYPGARCDSDSVHYSFSFDKDIEQEWSWSERYSPQPEILKYQQFVADKLDLRRNIKFDTRVAETVFDESTNKWTVTTDAGDNVTCRYLIMATGCLSNSRMPDMKGMDSYKGDVYHTGQWPHEGVDFTGKRVGIIGTGSSAIQAIPQIAKQAKHLTVFQRTPNYSLPAQNHKLDPEYVAEVKANYPELREAARWSAGGMPRPVPTKSALEVSAEEREAAYRKAWEGGGADMLGVFTDIATNKEANETAAEFMRARIDEIVKDPAVAEMLKPYDYPIGTKRICIDIDYFETYNRDNVTLINVKKDPIQELTPEGLRTGEQEFEFDAIVFATGFDAMTGALTSINIKGRGGDTLKEAWAAGPRTYLGLMSHGFPNMFMITGPGSPSVLSNMTTSLEQHVEFVTDYIEKLDAKGVVAVEPDLKAQDDWVDTVNEVAKMSLHTDDSVNSWYLGANVPGKPRVFMPYIGGVGAYRQICNDVAANDYEGFNETLPGATAQGTSAMAGQSA